MQFSKTAFRFFFKFQSENDADKTLVVEEKSEDINETVVHEKTLEENEAIAEEKVEKIEAEEAAPLASMEHDPAPLASLDSTASSEMPSI